MSSNPINTFPIQNFIQQVKNADQGQQKEIRLDIKTAKTLALTLGEVTAKLTQDYEELFYKLRQSSNSQVISVSMDGGGFEEDKT
jgi:hypothetical protein